MESHLRTVLKTLSWRLVAVGITSSLAWAATGSVEAAVAIGTADSLVKLVVFYAHERAWARIPLGYAAGFASKPRRSPKAEPSTASPESTS